MLLHSVTDIGTLLASETLHNQVSVAGIIHYAADWPTCLNSSSIPDYLR